MRILKLPISKEQLISLEAGEEVLISGTIYTARDAAHKRLVELIKEGKKLPFNLDNACIYYVGMTPAKPNMVCGSAGPTSSYRMDDYTEDLLKLGLKVMIGKGERSKKLKDDLVKYQAVYISALGGTGALINQKIKKATLVAFEDLGTEAIYRLEVEGLYGIVSYDSNGGSAFK